ncbi:gliding motility-associated C-terminal domain-containing protein, partial [Capnocytophaga leadbetteri]|uniref:Ig-like domain-containing protein n=1 Tax=Capnocytophaga leadbetteri TaxID=327575 RepID=UPI0028EFAB4F
MQLLNSQTFKGLLIAFLCLSWGAKAQVAVNSAVAQSEVHFANNTNFEIGTLTIKIKLPPAKNTAEVTVTLPTGIEYVVGSVNKGANATSVSQVAGSPINKPVFTLVGTPNTEVAFTIKRKLTKAATDALAGRYLTDRVKATVTGETPDEKDSNQYRVTPPVVTVQDVVGVDGASLGENTATFGIRNTGVGYAHTIYFSVDYPANVTNVRFTPPAGVTLTHVGNVPAGFPDAGKPLYSLTKTGGFANNELVTITETYKIAPALCGKQTKIGYVPYWGFSATNLFAQNTKVDRDIKVRTYTPSVKQTQDGNKRYFVEGAGLTAAAGQKLGTFYTAFKNESTDATAYNNRLNNLYQILTNFKPDNFYIIATDGTKIPVPSTFINNVNSTGFDFRNLPALADAALTGKDIGFTDEDADGFRDDLKPGAEVRICFDLVATGTPFPCNYTLSINPSFYYHYESACGETIELRDSPYVYARYFGRVNKTAFPAQLLKNAPEKGRIAPNMNSVGVVERFQGDASARNNDIRYRYYMQLPSGIALKNVVFYYAREVGDTSVPSVAIGNIPAGGLLDFTTPETPPAGVSVYDARLWGYISFDIELTDCTGLSNATSIDYKVFVMNRNQGGTTFTPIPILCESVNVALGCSVPCGVNGPEMLSTKVERADNSYGWTDATMTQRVQRANISAEQRRKVLHLDDVEFFAEGKQSPNAAADNLFYYTAVEKRVNLDPKFIKVKIGTHEVTLQATDPGVVTRATNANGNYYRWNLTDALPSGILAAGQTFSVVATYQVNNPSNSSSSEEQSGKTSYFYTLADKNDPAVSPQGYHTNALRCGLDLIPVFTFANTGIAYGMNGFGVSACTPSYIGGRFIHFGRAQNSGSNLYTEEYRPGILMRKIVLKIPLSYKITDNPEYFYTANIADTKKASSDQSSVITPLANWVESTEGNNRVYTYLNPVNRTDPYHLPAGIVATTYSQWLRVKVQASCKSKEFTGTEAAKRAAAIAAGEIGTYVVECEDYYYHYADSPTPLVVEKTNYSVMNMASKPQLLLLARGQGSTIRANRSEQQTVFSIETRYNTAPNAWISIPDVTGMEVLGLEEVNNALATTVLHTFTPVTSISGEKMYFLNQTLQVGAANQKYYRLKFKLTNCSNPQMKFKVYAGWNCEGNPTGGLREACDENFLEYTVNIAQSKKEIEVGSSPTSLPMCTQTPFEYIVKSTDEGDIFGANLIVTQQPGIIISDVEVEYPLASGKVYNTATLVDGKKIGVTTVGGKTTYQLSDILPKGSLPGSVSTNVENNQRFKVRFNVQPECNFVSGSSFDIDLEGNNLCGVPAVGPKIVAIVAGVQNASVNNYNVLLSTIDYVSGNANACDLGATYKVRVVVNATPANPSFEIGDNARLHIRFPQSYDIQNSDITINRNAFPQATFNWVNPTIESRNVVGNETEIVMVVPKGMKDTHYFDVFLKIKQNANTLVDCAVERSLKVLTTDKVTNIPCATLTPPTCPALVVSTSPERTAVIKNNRSEISFADVQVTAIPQVNKENLTVQYKLANAAGATAYNGRLVISLYNDLNNNGLVDSGEVLATHTSTQSLAANATSAVQSFTFLADQSQVCRLRLAIRNEDNKCLCGNKELALPTPAHISGLVSNLTTCETESVTFVYNTAAAAYNSYTWSPASYLSAANIATPTFLYSGTKLTAPLTVTYTLTVRRTNGCESTQTVTVVVTPNTATPSPTTVNLCSGNTVQSLKTYLGGLVSGTLKVYATATAAAELANTTALTDNTTYYYSAQVAGECESTRQSILVKITTMPTVSSSYTYCAGTKVATLWDAIDPTDSDRLLRIYTTATGGAPLDRTDLLQAGNYYVAKIAKNGANITCETPRALTTVHIPTVATPTVSATPALCPTTAAGSVSFAGYVTATAGNTLRWYATATATTPLAAAPTISTQVANSTSQTAYVSQVSATGCESGRAVITLVVNDTTPPTLNAPAPLVVDCHNAAANISTWLNSATATDSCGTVSLTNTYSAPADFCNVPSGTLTISFVAKDPFGNTTTQTRTITLINIKAENDTFTVTHGAVATTTASSVLTNDKVGTQTATAATVSMTVVTPATGVTGSATPTLNADGTVTVPAGTKSGTYQIGYKICQTVAAVTVCDTATATIVVGAPTITATPDTFTITTGTSTSSVIDNDHIGTATTTTSTVSIGVVTGATPKTPGANTPSLNTTDGTITVPNNTPAGTYSIVYQICEKLNPGNCATSTAVVTVATPTITATPDTFTITTGTSTSSVIDNDHIGTATTTTSTVSIGVVTGATPKTPGANTPSLNTTDGTITVPNNTPAGTYSIVYQICEKLNPGNCATSTVVVTVATPTITATPDTFTITTGTSTSSVIDNDHIGTATTTTSTVSIGVVTGATPKTPGANTPSLNTTDGTITVPNNTPAGTYSIVYQICEKLNPGNCATSTVVVTVATPTITATPDTFTITTGTSTSSVIDN